MIRLILISMLIYGCLLPQKTKYYLKPTSESDWVNYWIEQDSTYLKVSKNSYNYNEKIKDTIGGNEKFITIKKRSVYTLLYSKLSGNYVFILKIDKTNGRGGTIRCFVVNNGFKIDGSASFLIY